MNEPTCITKAREHCAKFQSLKLEDTSASFREDGDGTVWRVSQLLAEYDTMKQRAEAAEASLAVAWASMETMQSVIDTLIAEREALRKDAALLREFVSSDEIAMTYQTMRQYRAALLKFLTAALAVQPTTGEGA